MSAVPHALVVSPFATRGGAEQWLLDVVDHTDRVVFRHVVLQEGPLVDDLRDRGADVGVLPTGRRAGQVARTSMRLLADLRRRRPDVVLSNGVKAAAAATPAARLARVPSVWAKHDFAWDRRLGRPLGRLSDVVVAVSRGVAQATGRDDVVLVPPASRIDPVSREEARPVVATWGVPVDDGPLLGMAARLDPVKGIDDAIRALALWSAAPWRLVVVGGPDPAAPDERARLQALARELGVQDRVHLVGRIPGAARWFAAFDALGVLTRTEDGFGREGFGLTALEALRAGVPVIGSWDSPEVARFAGLAGVVVPPSDPPAVAEALARLRRSGPGQDPAVARLVADHPSPAEVADRVADTLVRAARRGAR